MTRHYEIATPYATVAVEEDGAGDIPLVLIHGNSSCRSIFRHQFDHFAGRYRVIAFDLPGHGQSSDATDPQRTYSMPGYAETAVAMLDRIGVTEATVFGWSLGGHIGIEMIPRFPGLRGLMITGTPPVGPHDAADGFIPSAHMHLTGQEHFSDEDVDAYARTTAGAPFEPFMRDAVARTDGRARKFMFDAFASGKGIDQRRTVGTSTVPLAVVNGGSEPFVNLDYVDGVTYANLWENRCLRLPGLGHAPFWEAPELFNPLLDRFLRDIGQGRG